ncbi:MAG: hypothetical protein JRI46_03960 [Deltaproteobacteria bacterium]|nr:hypothetical protein [Deltaproteobacteria bacterium]
MFKRLLYSLVLGGIVGLVLGTNTLYAQYRESWHTDEATYFIGCENTDADAAKEVVFFWNEGPSNYHIVVIDGVRGKMEWDSGEWHYISQGRSDVGIQSRTYPRLIDVNNDGKYEILFYGRKSGSDNNEWHLYEYTGSYKGLGKEEPSQKVYKPAVFQDYPNLHFYPLPTCDEIK